MAGLYPSTVSYLDVKASIGGQYAPATAHAADVNALLANPYGVATMHSVVVQVAVRADHSPSRQAYSVAATSGSEEESDVIYSNIIFPECISYGSTGSPRYMTDKVEVTSGDEERNARWTYPKHEYNIELSNLPADEIAEIMNIWHVCSGPHAGFLFLDPMDHTSAADATRLSGTDVSPTDQLVGTAVGSQATYPIYKYYKHSSGREKQRRILYPKEGTLRIAVDGFECFNWSYSYGTHLLTFLQPVPSTTETLSKVGPNITGGSYFSQLKVGDLLYIDGWSDPAYNFPEGGDPVRVRNVDATTLVLEHYDGTDYGNANFTNESVTVKSALPPSGAEIRSGYYFYVPVRFGDDDNAESEIIAGLRESAIADFRSITLREIFE